MTAHSNAIFLSNRLEDSQITSLNLIIRPKESRSTAEILFTPAGRKSVQKCGASRYAISEFPISHRGGIVAEWTLVRLKLKKNIAFTP